MFGYIRTVSLWFRLQPHKTTQFKVIKPIYVYLEKIVCIEEYLIYVYIWFRFTFIYILLVIKII